ncbi:MAG: hypothetical protein RIB45_13150 [Marivibrio sp.]|uniref:hypothetical protein n=1 Tax=Marivibrio sp. TaxID=2039719 RepID=UPI0032EC0ADE
MTIRLIRPLAAAAAAFIALAACTSAPIGAFNDYVLTKTQVQPAYDVGNFRFLHANQQMPVAVAGGVLGESPQALGEALADHMTGRTPAGRTEFVYRPDVPADASRLAVKADPPIDMSARSLCAGERLDESAEKTAAGAATLLIAYCNRDHVLSATRLTVDVSRDRRGLAAPAFRRGAQLAARLLFPIRDPNDDPDPFWRMRN